MISFWPRSYWPNFLKAIYEASIRNSAWLRKCAYLRLSELIQLKMIRFCPFLSISGRFHTAVNTRWMWYESCLFVIGPWLANEQKELFDLFLIHEKSHSRNSSESEIARVRDWESALFSPVNKTGSERFLPDFFILPGLLPRILERSGYKIWSITWPVEGIRRMPGNIMEEKILNVF